MWKCKKGQKRSQKITQRDLLLLDPRVLRIHPPQNDFSPYIHNHLKKLLTLHPNTLPHNKNDVQLKESGHLPSCRTTLCTPFLRKMMTKCLHMILSGFDCRSDRVANILEVALSPKDIQHKSRQEPQFCRTKMQHGVRSLTSRGNHLSRFLNRTLQKTHRLIMMFCEQSREKSDRPSLLSALHKPSQMTHL